MNIYSHAVLFTAPYYGKRLLKDSLERTRNGWDSLCQGAVFKGSGNIVLARIESAAAFALVGSSGIFTGVTVGVVVPCFLIVTSGLNLLSRIPGISSFQNVQNFTKQTNDLIHRSFRVCLIAFPVIFVFLATSAFNTFIPGVLDPKNRGFKAIDWMVKPLGPLKTVEFNGYYGAKNDYFLPVMEDYFRALSYDSVPSRLSASHVRVHFRF